MNIFSDAAEMEEKEDLVVLGTVETNFIDNPKVYFGDSHKSHTISTLSRVRVDYVLKGSYDTVPQPAPAHTSPQRLLRHCFKTDI